MFANVIVKMGLRFLQHIAYAGLHLLIPTWAQLAHQNKHSAFRQMSAQEGSERATDELAKIKCSDVDQC